MKIFVDGTVLQQPTTGISKSLLEIMEIVIKFIYKYFFNI